MYEQTFMGKARKKDDDEEYRPRASRQKKVVKQVAARVLKDKVAARVLPVEPVIEEAPGQPQKKRQHKSWKERDRKETRTGRKRYDKKEGDVSCLMQGCDRIFKATREMMKHMVKEHPAVCEPGELRRYRDKLIDTVQCQTCGKPISKRNLAAHRLSCANRSEA